MEIAKILAVSLGTSALAVLITNAMVTERLRLWVHVRFGVSLECPFCLGWWLAIPVTGMVCYGEGWVQIPYYLAGVGGAAIASELILRK